MLREAKVSLDKLWVEYNNSSMAVHNTATSEFNEEVEMSEFMQWMTRNQVQVIERDELNQYLMEFRIRDSGSIIAYWRSQNERFSILTRMVMNVFSIFSMSAEFERVFSAVKHTIIDERARFKSRFIEALECCKSWFQAEVFIEISINAVMTKEFEEQLLEQMEAAEAAEEGGGA